MPRKVIILYNSGTMRFRGCRNVLAAAAVAPHRKPISRWHKCTFHLRSQRTQSIHLYNTVYYTFEDKQTHALYSATLCTLLDWSKVYLVCAVGACAFAQMSSTTTTTAYIIIQRETRSRTTTLFYIHYGVTLVQWQCWRIAQTHVNCQMILLVQRTDRTDRTPYVNDNETAISFYPTKSVNIFFCIFVVSQRLINCSWTTKGHDDADAIRLFGKTKFNAIVDAIFMWFAFDKAR